MGQHYVTNYTIISTLFNDLKELEFLLLVSVRLRYIAKDMFQGLHKLSTLKLTDNLISKVDVKIFSSLTALRHLYLDYNLISNLNSTSFPHTWQEGLHHIDLSYNPWDCTCDLL